MIGYLTFVGNTSMEVRVDTYVENIAGERRPINRAYVTLVALDENDTPKQVPGLLIESKTEMAEWEGAKKRRQMRKMRKEEGF